MIDTPNHGDKINRVNKSIKLNKSQKPNQFSNFLRWVIYLILLSIGGGLSYSWYFLNQKLSPLVEKELTNFLNRPIILGNVESVFISGVTFGKTEIPATKTDSDYSSMEEIRVKINPLKLLLDKRLELELTIIEPNIYIEEDDSNIWIETKLNKGTSKWRDIDISLKSIHLQNTHLTLKTNSQNNDSQSNLKLKVSSSQVFFSPQLINFNTKGKSIKGGSFNLDGFYKRPQKQLNLSFNSKETLAEEINPLFDLPLQFQKGTFDSLLQINLTHNQLQSFTGEATLNQVDFQLPNLSQPLQKTEGKVIFNNSLLQLDNIQTDFGSINTNFNGLIDIKGDVDIHGKIKPIEVKKAISSINLPPPSLNLEGKIKADIFLNGKVKKPQLTTKITTINKAKIDKVELNQAQAYLHLFKSNLTIEKLTLFPTMGGEITGEGNFNLDENKPNFLLDFETKNIPGKKVTDIYVQNMPLDIGKVSGKYNLSGSWKQFNQSLLTGNTELELADGKAVISNLKHDQKNWQANVNLDKINLAKLPDIPCEKLNCNDSKLNANLFVSGVREKITKDNIEVKGNANFNLAGGIVNLKNLQLNKGNWQTLVESKEVKLANFLPDNITNLKGKINSNLTISGNFDNQENLMVSGEGELNLSQGKVNFNNFNLHNNIFNTQLVSNSLELNKFSPQLRGKAKGKLNVSGDINNLTPEKIEIAGDIHLNEGLDFIKQPLKTSFNWDGEKLQINNATTKEITAKGIINLDIENKQITDFNLDLLAQKIDLKDLPLSLPSSLNRLTYDGLVNFHGKIFGTLEQPNLLGDITLNDFNLTAFNFNPLVGKIDIKAKEKVELNLSEKGDKGDKINLVLDANYHPTQINLQANQAQFIGLKNDQLFSIDANNIPVNKLTQSFVNSLPISSPQLGGKMSAKLDINLDNFDFIASEVVIKNPVIANFKGDLISTNLEYSHSQGNLKINDGKITKKNSNYLFEGNVKPLQENPEFAATIAVEKGNIQDFLESLEIFELSDFKRGMKPPKYGTVKDLYPSNHNLNSSNPQPLASIGKEKSTLSLPLEYFEEIKKTWEENQQKKLASSIPELKDLQGNFDGSLEIEGTLKEGVKSKFNFEGKDWNWRNYQVDLIELKGSYKDGFLTFLPIKIQQDKSLLSLTGSFNKERLSGQIRVENLPVNEVKKVVTLPNIDGMINANIAISGSEESPLAKGQITINDATLNNTKIESNQANFNYKNSRLDFFASSILSDKIEPLTIKGSFPYQLFPNSITPNNNQFDVSLNITDQLFPLLNIITDKQIDWLEGKGKIKLNIYGNYEQSSNQITNINTQGIANVENAIIAAKIFPDTPLTDVNGEILFNFDRINVNNFTGKFSGGDINITGLLPISLNNNQQTTNSYQKNPLMVNFDNIAIDLKDLYEGGIKGNLQINGSIINPTIIGNLELFEGQIFLGEKKVKKVEISQNKESLNKTKLEGLNLKLGSNIKITKEPLLNVFATGNLTLKGSLNNLQPEGKIHLKKGRVNLFTSQLKLAEDYDNIAEFTPKNGFNPYLDLQLLASVTETSRHQFIDTPVASEIKDLSNSEVGTIQTIRVKANVKGLSDQIADKINLTSSPQRSESEIIALLGGGFFNNFNQGNTNLGLANLASAAFLGSFQGELQDVLGFDEFRLFPTQIINEEKRTSTLGLGAEIGLDIGSNFSVSVMKILTNEQAPQYSVRYRLNDQILFRGSSDFGNDNRGLIEFESRF